MVTFHNSTYEDFEADLIRQLGLTMSIERLREIGMMSARRSAIAATTAQQTATKPPAQPTDFESRYTACQTAAERRAFVRANRAQAREYLRTNRDAPQSFAAATTTASASTRPRSKLIRRKLK